MGDADAAENATPGCGCNTRRAGTLSRTAAVTMEQTRETFRGSPDRTPVASRRLRFGIACRVFIGGLLCQLIATGIVPCENTGHAVRTQ
jgi:hypothetical protein